MTLKLFFLFCILCFACHLKERQIQAETVALQNNEQSSDSVALTSNNITSPESNPGTIPDSSANIGVIDNGVPAASSNPQAIKILFTGTFHGDEVEEGAGELPWIGLFTDENENFLLKSTRLIATRVVDGLLDDEEKGEMTGWEIATQNDEYPVMLLSGGDIREGKVEHGEVPATLYPGDSVQFDFNGIHYLLYATGSSHIDSLRGVTNVSDYNLYVMQTVKGENHRTLLVGHANFDDAMTSILWSGDLDRDGYLDLLIDMSRHYNQRLPTLFLSKPAGADKVVVPVAEHSSVGC